MNYEADQQRPQISDLNFDKFPYTSYVCLLEEKIQNRGMYLFLWKRCNGSKKWRWLIQWMITNLHHQYEVFRCRILMPLMRGLLQR